ncbi:adipocyte plasma membrane-associated protein-like [Nylanderia fulva]|uniref:adipocyte plasma membrane-associated protein-like n=1 Tax=Nylanderia fulva TaxID=613905 RepID=UPI0010FBA060|nr:adipocyte plasma membrane-associated protein-like [Nylanderia fulva]XP_029174110.1 adipocyte plasma membrane-associated protein-like [Nylanderia fulva]
MSYLKSVGTAVIYIGLFLAFVTFIPGLPPNTEFREYSIVEPRDVDPKIGPKNRLNNVEKLFEGRFVGPEAFASYDGQLYTGIHDGYVLRIEEDTLVPIAKFGKKCDGLWQEHKCGRPLGMRFDKKGNLYVVDSYYGIFKVNVESGEYKNIVNTSKPIDGKIPHIPNSIDVSENGDLYWTTSSTDFALYDGALTFLADPTGRFIRYNAAKKKNEVLLKNLGFPNGVILSDDESFVLVSESLECRILKYHLKGPKAGQKEVFIDGLPGIPDNIQSDGQTGFLVTTVFTITPEHPLLSLSLTPHPNLRKMILRLALLMELPFKLLQDIYPNTFTEKVIHAIGSFQLGEIFNTYKKSFVLRIDASGNIMELLSSDDDAFYGISEAYIHNGFVWFGSPWRNYIGRVSLKQAFPDLSNNEKQSSRTRESAAASNVKSEKAKRDTVSASASTTSKPTPTPTTTPKPTTSTTSKPTAPKPSPTPKVDKPTTTDSSNAKPSKTKPISQSANDAKVKKNAETVSDAKPNTKSNSPNAKTETDNKKEGAAKNVKVEQDASIKEKVQKSPPKKVKTIEANRPKDDL